MLLALLVAVAAVVVVVGNDIFKIHGWLVAVIYCY
jgi:hypothetical protein